MITIDELLDELTTIIIKSAKPNGDHFVCNKTEELASIADILRRNGRAYFFEQSTWTMQLCDREGQLIKWSRSGEV